MGVESGSAGGCVSASFSVAGGVAGGTFEEGGAFCRGFSCEREGAGGLDMGEGCAGASVSSSKDACRASLMAEETAISFCRDARIGGGCGLWASSGKAADVRGQRGLGAAASAEQIHDMGGFAGIGTLY